MAVISIKAKNLQPQGEVSLVQFGLFLSPGEEQELVGLATIDTIFKSVEIARLLERKSLSVKITRDDGSIRFADSDGFTFASESKLGDDSSGPTPHTPVTLDSVNSNGLVLDFANQKLGLNPASPGGPGSMASTDRSWLLTRQAENVFHVSNAGPYGPNQFASIRQAIAAVVGATDTNRFVISVAPGHYIESAIIVPAYVFIVGVEMGSVIVEPDAPDHHVFELRANSGLTFLMIRNAGAGFAGIYCNDVGVFAIVHKVTIFDCDIGILCASVTQDCQTYFEYVDTNGGSIGLKVTSAGGFQNFVNIENFYNFASLAGVNPSVGVLLDGPDVVLTGQSIGFDGSDNTGTAIRVVNGALVDIKAASVTSWGIGFEAPNDGGTPEVRLASVPFRDNGTDISIPNTLAQGAITGSANENKVTIDSFSISFNLLDPDNGEFITSGVQKARQADGTYTDISTIVTESSTMGYMEGAELSDGGGLVVNVSMGFGYLEIEPEILRRFDWLDTSITVPANQSSYLYFDSTGMLIADASFPETHLVILLGRVVTHATGIDFIDNAGLDAEHTANIYDTLFRQGIGPVYASGSTVSESGTRQLDVTAGSYFLSTRNFRPSGGAAISWTAYYLSGLGGFTRVSQSVVDNAFYDDGSGTLAAIGAGNYAKHALYVIGDGAQERYMLVYAQAQYAALTLAEQGAIPNPPASFTDGVALIATLIVQQGLSSIREILDARPKIGFQASSVAATTFHGNLLGLLNDDHKQYLLVNGTRAMTGDLNMGTHNVSNAGTYNGVTVQTHAGRHLPGGSDPETTAAAITLVPDLANATGTANAFARSDHVHNVPTAAGVTLTPDLSNAQGVSANFARADHIHNIPTATPSGLNANTANTQGGNASFARSDHLHAIASGAASTQTPNQANATGTSANFARADHVHSIPTAAAVTQNADQANADGSAATFARSDHVHSIPTAAPVSVASANAQGSATTLAKSDHVHQGIHSLRANNGTQRFGDQNLQNGVGVTVTDDGSGTFTFETTNGPNELKVTTGAGLVANYSAGKVRFNGTLTSISASSITLTGNITNGVIYVDTDATVKQTGSGVAAPPDTVVLAKFTTSVGAITSLTDERTFLNQNETVGLVGDIVTILPDASTSAGATNRWADAAHTHAIATAAAITQTPDQANAKGTSSSFARADHVHNVPTAAPVTLNPDVANTQGSLTSFSRADHIHNVPTATAVGLNAGSTSTQGASTSFSRADHTHAIASGVVSGQTPDNASAAGTSTNFARADHVHNIPTATASGLNAGTTNTQGANASFARSDHTHAVASGVVSSQPPDQANAAGTSTNFARADHIHTVPTATPITQNADQTNTQGTAASFARSDHIHNIPTAIAVDVGSANAQGSATTLAKSDHVHKGIHSYSVFGGTARFGDIVVKPGSGITIVDNGDNSFTFDTVDAANEFVVTNGGGLVVNYTAGKVWFGSTFTSVAAGNLTLTASQTNWFIYVDVDATVKNAAAVPPNAIPLARFTTSGSAITALLDAREQVNHDVVFGAAGDIVTIVPDASAAAGATNKHADAGHTHAIATAAVITQNPDQANAKGSSTSFARADHVHNIPTAAAAGQTPDSANAQGVSTSFARADHVHNIPTAAAVGLDASSTSTQGAAATFARSNHTHAIASGVVSGQAPDQANAAGTSANFARADHVHSIPTAAATGLNAGSTSTQGSAATFTRSDHTHAIASGAPSTQNPDQTNTTGTSTNFARADHIHNVPTAVPVTVNPDVTNTQGTSTSFARADHIHNVPTAAAVGLNTGSTSTQGSATTFARSDHTHAIASATAVTTSANANALGASASFARADHTHQLTAATASNDHLPQYDGSNWQATYPENVLQLSRATGFKDDWISGFVNGAAGWVSTIIGGGSVAAIDTTKLDSAHVGIAALTSGGAAARYANLTILSTMILGGGAISIEVLFQLSTLTNALYRIGLGDNLTNTDFNNGVYLEFNSATSANWLIKTASGGSRTSTTTATAATANAWHKLVISINAAASSVSYTMDGSSLGAAITATIPTAAIGPVLLADSLAATTTTLYVDYYQYAQRFTTAR